MSNAGSRGTLNQVSFSAFAASAIGIKKIGSLNPGATTTFGGSETSRTLGDETSRTLRFSPWFCRECRRAPGVSLWPLKCYIAMLCSAQDFVPGIKAATLWKVDVLIQVLTGFRCCICGVGLQ